MQAGLLLPHFGNHLAGGDIVSQASAAEAAGFDSVWVRDHMFLKAKSPGGEGQPFYEAMTVIAAVAARTSTISIGTAALIPVRHPVHIAAISSTLVAMFGPRFIWGVGSGNSEHEFESVGKGGVDRASLVLSSIAAMRELWSRTDVSWDDGLVRFDHVTLNPRPEQPVPFWYCAGNPKSARLAATICDGWLPGRINLSTLVRRVETIEQLSEKSGRPRPVIGVVPATAVGTTRDIALERVDIAQLLSTANNARFWERPPGGRFQSIADLDGVLLHGTPDDVVQQCESLNRAGVDHVVFDLRFAFADWDDQFDLLKREVLPHVHALAAQSAPTQPTVSDSIA